MRINLKLNSYRCEMNRIHLSTSLTSLINQTNIMNDCLQEHVNFALVKRQLNKALEEEAFIGFKDELELLLKKDEQVRGHDYLKLWMKTFFVIAMNANYIIADAATHDMLQNKLNYDQKAELLRMMRGSKHEPRGHVNVN